MKSELRDLITVRVVKELPVGLGVETENGQYVSCANAKSHEIRTASPIGSRPI